MDFNNCNGNIKLKFVSIIIFKMSNLTLDKWKYLEYTELKGS